MNIFSKPVIFSALVFPGSGYFFLNKPKQGLVFILGVMICLAAVFYDSLFKAQVIAEKIVSGTLPIDIALIQQEILTTQGVLPPILLSTLTLLIACFWIVGIIDCYRLQRAQSHIE